MESLAIFLTGFLVALRGKFTFLICTQNLFNTQQEFTYHQRVRITGGFYRGIEGVIIDKRWNGYLVSFERNPFKVPIEFLIRGGPSIVTVRAEHLEAMEVEDK